MAQSETVIIALKFATGVVIAADSQVSDTTSLVRWRVEKLEPINNLPLVVGFSGSLGRAKVAREALRSRFNHATQVAKIARLRNSMDDCLQPVYDQIKRSNREVLSNSIWEIGLLGLVACWSEGAPHIIEYELNGDTDTHDWFHAVGSGAKTAYSIWRTLGERKLATLDERKALWVALRILRTCVSVEMYGVSGPFHAWVVTEKGARRVSEEERDAQFRLIEEWESRQLSLLIDF